MGWFDRKQEPGPAAPNPFLPSSPPPAPDQSPANPWLTTPVEPVEASAPVVERSQAPGPGRPKSERPRAVRIGLSVTEAERDRWAAAARAAGFKQIARWVREVVAAELARDGAGRPAGELAAARLELVRIGTNLNQIARALNTATSVGEKIEAQMVRRDLAGISEQIEALRASLRGAGAS